MPSTTVKRQNESGMEWTPVASTLFDQRGQGESASVFERNLRALARTSPGAVQLLRCATPRVDVKFLETQDGALAGEIEIITDFGWQSATDSGGVRAMCSRRAPLREAEQIASQVDVSQTAAIAVAGFGMGYHVASLARKLRRSGIMLVFEPDVSLLRAVLERVDHSDWFTTSNVMILTDPDDSPTMSAAMSGVEGLIMMGFALVEHPACSQRIGDAKLRFHTRLQGVVEAVRTMVATTMMQVGTTVRNLVSNLGWYTSCPGISDLAGIARGKHAFVISAGPSLERNINQLLRPGVREHSVIIAAQTVLRPLLARGIKPHFVTALDHSDISARFYEGLTAADVEGITLVIEPKASPAIPLAFPGRIRCVQDRFLDSLLGEALARPMGSLTPGATVAHLAYYLARHLGCDPVVLVGQDLGFTDGQYYAANAAIHDVWACELNEFNTLEMMEWTRIKRMGAHLRKVHDQHGRPIYTDAQMSTYLTQFERDFAKDSALGLRVIDATEGGVAKACSVCEPLASVVDRVVIGSAAGTKVEPDSPQQGAADLTGAYDARVRELRTGAARISKLCKQAESVLIEMLEHHDDQPRVNRLIARVHRLREQVEQSGECYKLIHYLNQSGAFSRIRSDRAIHLDESHSPLSRQKAEIRRDLENVRQLGSAADSLGDILVQRVPVGQHKPHGEQSHAKTRRQASPRNAKTVTSTGSPQRVWAVISGGSSRASVSGSSESRQSTLSCTLHRLNECESIEGIIVLSERDLYSPSSLTLAAPSKRVVVCDVDAQRSRARLETIAGLRAWSRECWRGGLFGATCYDEVFEPGATLNALRGVGATAALLIGADWSWVDPSLCDEVVERYLTDPDVLRMTFSQAAPGLAGCVVSRSVIESFKALEDARPDVPALGLALGYVPGSPVLDPAGTRACVIATPAVRDCGMSFTSDGVGATSGPRTSNASETVRSIRAETATVDQPFPSNLTLDVPLQDATSWASRAMTEVASGTRNATVTLLADADTAQYAASLACLARESGMRVHIRAAADTGLECLQSILRSSPHVFSLDFVRTDAEILSGPSANAACRTSVDLAGKVCRQLVADAGAIFTTERANGMPRTRVVPRLVRCDSTYELIEAFFDEWTAMLGTAIIDPLPRSLPGQRIQPLPIPRQYRERLAGTTMYVNRTGDVAVDPRGIKPPRGAVLTTPAVNLALTPLAESWRQILACRREAGLPGQSDDRTQS